MIQHTTQRVVSSTMSTSEPFFPFDSYGSVAIMILDDDDNGRAIMMEMRVPFVCV